MKKVCFLIPTIEILEPHNYVFLANALINRGESAYLCFIDSLAIHAGAVAGKVKKIDRPLHVGESLDVEQFVFTDLSEFDYIWVLSFGRREAFLDKIELLWNLSQQVQVINSIDSLLFLHNKYHLNSLSEVIKIPETYASSDFEYLVKVFHEKGGSWILKPPAESFGRGVFILKPGDSNVEVLLEAMTGYGLEKKYCIMQRFIPEITRGEKRVLFAAGEVVGQYKRIAPVGAHRTNLHQGAKAVESQLESGESELCKILGKYFTELGAYFVGVDMVYPYIIELNVLNPGGINTIKKLSNLDIADTIVDRIIR